VNIPPYTEWLGTKLSFYQFIYLICVCKGTAANINVTVEVRWLQSWCLWIRAS